MNRHFTLAAFFVVMLGTQGIAVAADPTVPAAQSAQPRPSPVREVIVIIKTHFDIGYTHRVKEIVHHYRTAMIDKAMNIMDAGNDLPPEQQFAWTGPGWVMSKVLEDWEGQTPERRKRLDDYVKAGKFRFHALPFTLESDACEPEEMARGFVFASNLCRKYGLPLPRSGKMTDVPSHGGALATVLAHGGVRFMHIGCNWPSGCVKTPGLYWWEGPDGSRVLTFYSNTYGTCVPSFLPRWYSDRDPFIARDLAPPADWPYKVWPAIIVTPDNTGPPTADQVKSLFDDAAKKLVGLKVHMGTMDDFVDAILKDNPELPVVKGEMPDTWIHGIMCDPGGIKLSRQTHPLLASAEALHTQLDLWGVAQPPIANQVELAYEKILLYGEHTWGGAASINQYGEAFQKVDPKSYAGLEASWEDKTDYIREASRITRGLMETNLQSLARAVKHDGPCLVVYNPLPWPRSGMVELGGDRVLVKDVPPCGYRAQRLPPNITRMAPRKTTVPDMIENAFFKLTVDPARGAITSLVDKRTGREWIDAAEPHGLGSYLNERFTFEQTLQYTIAYQNGRAFGFQGAKGEWPHPGMYKSGMISEKQVPYRAASAGQGTATIDASSATIECPADPAHHLPAIVLRITLPQDQPYVELELTIKDKAKDNWPEADWLCLPFKVRDPQFRVYRQLGVMNPATDILPGANRHLYSVGHGVTIADADGSGIAICPMDHPLVSLDQPGCWKYSDDFISRKPVVYLNLYNNQWNTNFRYWYPGTWSSRVRLWTFDRQTPADAVIASPAIEARNPLLAVRVDGTGGELPTEQASLAVSRPGVLVTAFGQNPDGPGTLLRVWDQSGQSGQLAVTLPRKFNTATPVNLRGESRSQPLAIAAGKLTFDLPAYAPASFILE
jgi:alpha-mannosidase